MNRAAACGAGLLALLAGAALAHLPQLRGRLIDLVGRADAVVAGTVVDTVPIDKRLNTTTIRVETSLRGALAAGETATFRSRPRFAPGKRFVFFLRRDGGALECIQESGTVFPARPDDDAVYGPTVTAIAAGLREPEAGRAAALRAALIPALSAPVAALRYYAVLDLAALAHHGMSADERRALQRLVDDPATDSAIRPVVAGLLHRSS